MSSWSEIFTWSPTARCSYTRRCQRHRRESNGSFRCGCSIGKENRGIFDGKGKAKNESSNQPVDAKITAKARIILSKARSDDDGVLVEVLRQIHELFGEDGTVANNQSRRWSQFWKGFEVDGSITPRCAALVRRLKSLKDLHKICQKPGNRTERVTKTAPELQESNDEVLMILPCLVPSIGTKLTYRVQFWIPLEQGDVGKDPPTNVARYDIIESIASAGLQEKMQKVSRTPEVKNNTNSFKNDLTAYRHVFDDHLSHPNNGRIGVDWKVISQGTTTKNRTVRNGYCLTTMYAEKMTPKQKQFAAELISKEEGGMVGAGRGGGD